MDINRAPKYIIWAPRNCEHQLKKIWLLKYIIWAHKMARFLHISTKIIKNSSITKAITNNCHNLDRITLLIGIFLNKSLILLIT